MVGLCNFCSRELSDVAEKNNLVYLLSMDRFLKPGRGRKEESWRACGDCFEEIAELESSLTGIDHGVPVPSSNPSKQYWFYDECSFCEQALNEERVHFGYGTELRGEDMINRDYLLCLDCCDEIKQFLSDIPKSTKEGDVYIGVPDEDPNVTVDEADLDAIRDRYKRCDIGDQIRCEVHNASTERSPSRYTVVEGEVTDFQPGGLRDRMVVSPDDSENSGYDEYYLECPLPAPHQAPYYNPIEVQARSGDSSERLGGVTVFEIVGQGTTGSSV